LIARVGAKRRDWAWTSLVSWIELFIEFFYLLDAFLDEEIFADTADEEGNDTHDKYNDPGGQKNASIDYREASVLDLASAASHQGGKNPNEWEDHQAVEDKFGNIANFWLDAFDFLDLLQEITVIELKCEVDHGTSCQHC